MEKVFLALILIIIMINSVRASDYKSFKKENGVMIIDGELSPAEWMKETSWDTSAIEKYHPDENICSKISKIINDSDYSLLIVGGTWCGDTKSEFPKLFKILDVCKIDDKKFDLIGVSTDKKINISAFENFVIRKVPTLIVKKAGKEIGRIEEFPELSWEENILIILGE